MYLHTKLIIQCIICVNAICTTALLCNLDKQHGPPVNLYHSVRHFLLTSDLSAGLDARAAAIVMRTVRNIVNTGRTIVCTIHQPSIDIFESFDELLLLKRGGQTIYAGRFRCLYTSFRKFQLIECLWSWRWYVVSTGKDLKCCKSELHSNFRKLIA